ncbi:hypothetical protein PIB30_011298 [Stylosanthes scabra]|uniref:Uncharacterized protein n=1 Tax=Stylosanthes scabra TaxID=79078 RepID=A0ABU6V4W5_9FABA|nr:hypothetical protein [Stylosanthes scabra]
MLVRKSLNAGDFYCQSLVKNGQTFAPESETSKSKIWESQVSIPFSIAKTTITFVGPLISLNATEKIKQYFPSHPQQRIVAFQDPILIGYFDIQNRLFKNPPKVSILAEQN